MESGLAIVKRKNHSHDNQKSLRQGLTPSKFDRLTPLLYNLKQLLKIMKIKRIGLYFIIRVGFFLLLLAISNARADTSKLKVTAELANIRLKPDIASSIIRHFPEGAILEALSKEGEWYLVRLEPDEAGFASGYIHESLVLELEPIPIQPEKKEKIEEKAEKEKKEEKVIPKPRPVVTPAKPFIGRFAFSLEGGGAYVSPADLNNGAQGLANYFSEYLGIQGKKEIVPLHLSYVIGGEVSLALFSRFELGIGVGYFFGEKESQVEYEKGQTKNTFLSRPKIQATPLRVVLSYSLFPFLYLKSGIEYYFAQCSYFYRFVSANSWQEWHGEASAQGLGALGGVGFEWPLSSRLSLLAEASARYAKIKKFEGKDTSRDSQGKSYREQGILYFYQGKISGENSYPLLFIREKRPTEAGVSDPRPAEIDFSGLTIKAGIKIRF